MSKLLIFLLVWLFLILKLCTFEFSEVTQSTLWMNAMLKCTVYFLIFFIFIIKFDRDRKCLCNHWICLLLDLTGSCTTMDKKWMEVNGACYGRCISKNGLSHFIGPGNYSFRSIRTDWVELKSVLFWREKIEWSQSAFGTNNKQTIIN